MSRAWIALSLFVLCLVVPALAWGHEFRPAQITLHEFAAGEVDVAVTEADAPELELSPPQGCTVIAPLRWRCSSGLHGELYVDGLTARTPTAVLRVIFADGRAEVSVVDGEHPRLELATTSAGTVDVVARHLGLGAAHLLAGLDHLAFILLLGFAAARRTWVRCVTAFTIGHSLTLAATVLGAWRVHAAPVEAVIALSVAYMALAVIDRARGGRGASQTGAGVCLAIGLLHGLGFSGVLLDAGVSGTRVWPALLGFNLGIEAAQLAFVLVMALVSVAGQRFVSARSQRAVATAAAYIVGSYAVALLLKRLMALGGGWV